MPPYAAKDMGDKNNDNLSSAGFLDESRFSTGERPLRMPGYANSLLSQSPSPNTPVENLVRHGTLETNRIIAALATKRRAEEDWTGSYPKRHQYQRCFGSSESKASLAIILKDRTIDTLDRQQNQEALRFMSSSGTVASRQRQFDPSAFACLESQRGYNAFLSSQLGIVQGLEAYNLPTQAQLLSQSLQHRDLTDVSLAQAHYLPLPNLQASLSSRHLNLPLLFQPRFLPGSSLHHFQRPMQASLATRLHNIEGELGLQAQSFGVSSLTPRLGQTVPIRGFPTEKLASQSRLSLPPCDEGQVLPYTSRGNFALGIDEDSNWLSEFHCFVRSELIEVFRAGREDCNSRNNSISYQQVGIRCRFCAHMSSSARAGRSSAFPSSLRQIYQSFTMMLRDHFGNCEAMPAAIHRRFLSSKEMPSQGATDSKRFWVYSAMKIGMADSSDGIIINERTVSVGSSASSFGTNPNEPWADDALASIALVLPRDRSLVSEFLVVLMSQVQLVRLTESERIGNRRSLHIGLTGFGCRCCCEHRRLGLCRVFPARRRTLPSKVNDLYDHIRRCTVTPQQVKDRLMGLKYQRDADSSPGRDEEKEFYDRIWTRLGHSSNSP
jgi:hypothetical protein